MSDSIPARRPLSFTVTLPLAFAVLPLLACGATAPEAPESASAPAATETAAAVDPSGPGLYEVRNYHFRPDLLDAYRAWANSEAIPYLSRQMDIVGFWFGTDIPAQVSGEPLGELGSANVTWIIRWDDMEQREATMAEAFGNEEWTDVFSQVPGGAESYLRIEARFMESAER